MTTDVNRMCRALSGVDYPADKATLVRAAQRAGADADTIRALETIPSVSYDRETDVLSVVQLESTQAQADRAVRRKLHQTLADRLATR